MCVWNRPSSLFGPNACDLAGKGSSWPFIGYYLFKMSLTGSGTPTLQFSDLKAKTRHFVETREGKEDPFVTPTRR